MRLLLVGLIVIALSCSADPVVEAPTEAEDQQAPQPTSKAAASGWEDLAALDEEVAKVLRYAWQIKSVQTSGGAMKILTDIRRVRTDVYTNALANICYVIDQKGGAPEVKEIQFLNSFGKQGFVYEQPSKCGELLNTPDLELFVALDTHTF